MVSGMEPTRSMPSVSMGLVFRVRPEQEKDRPRQVGLFSLPGTYTVRDGEHERTLWYFRGNDMAGALEVPREHGLSGQARRIQVLRSALFGIGQIIESAVSTKRFGQTDADAIKEIIETTLGENEPWIESEFGDNAPEWATRPLPKSWGIDE